VVDAVAAEERVEGGLEATPLRHLIVFLPSTQPVP